MIQRPIPLPTNRHITAQRDRKWPVAFALLALLSMVLVLTLGLIGWPRLQSVSLHYDLVRLRTEVENLQYQAQDLEANMERLRSPETLSQQAVVLGLTQPDSAMITSEGDGPR